MNFWFHVWHCDKAKLANTSPLWITIKALGHTTYELCDINMGATAIGKLKG